MLAHESGRCNAFDTYLPRRPRLCHNRAILNETEIALDGSIDELERLVTTVADFCRRHALDDNVEFDLNLVLEELFTNSLRHGGCQGVPAAADIRLRLLPAGVELQYRDRGLAFNPLEAPEPDLTAPLMDRKIGGLGVHLVRQIMQDVRYHRSADTNEVTMIRRMDPK